MLPKKNWLIYFMLIISTSTWGSAFIAGKFAIQSFEPATVAFFRFLGASLILVPVMYFRKEKIPKPTKKDWLLFMCLGLTGITFYNIFFFMASKHAPVIKSSLFIAANPVLIIILATVFLKEAISKNQVIGLIVALTGVSIIITEGDLSVFFTMGFELIDVVLLGAVVCWALYSVIGRVVLRKYSALVSTTYGIVFGTLFLFPFAYMETSLETIVNSSYTSWIAIAHMSIFVTVISFVMYYYGIQQIGAARASIFINFMPISAVIMATVFLQEAFTFSYVIGAAFVLSGVTLSTYKGRITLNSKG